MDSFIVVNDGRGRGGGEGKGPLSYGVEGSEGVTATSGGGGYEYYCTAICCAINVILIWVICK